MDVYLILLTAIAAFVSVAGVLLPAQAQRKERYRDVIERRRKALFEQARHEADNRGRKEELSAAQGLAMIYKMQALAGETATRARTLLMQAGIRDPKAPMYYLSARILLPVFFASFVLLLVGLSEREVQAAKVFWVIVMLVMAGFFLPRILIKNIADKRQAEISLSFPDSLDMLLICVQGGIGIEAAISRIAKVVAEHSEVLAEELGLLSAELGMLNDRKAAYQGFALRVGSGPARSFATAMLQAEQYGTSISKALRVLADETRDLRMAAAEQKAASLPPKLTVPMILFFLPPLFVIILGPAFLGLK